MKSIPPIQPFGSVPLLGQGPTKQQKEEAQRQQMTMRFQQAIQQLSMEIYSQLAINHINVDSVPCPETLRQLATHAQTAARCYFEGIGAIEKKEE